MLSSLCVMYLCLYMYVQNEILLFDLAETVCMCKWVRGCVGCSREESYSPVCLLQPFSLYLLHSESSSCAQWTFEVGWAIVLFNKCMCIFMTQILVRWKNKYIISKGEGEKGSKKEKLWLVEWIAVWSWVCLSMLPRV